MLERNTKKLYFNPGCALSLYKPEKEHEIFAYLKRIFPAIQMHNICCHHNPQLPKGSVIINVCGGCNKRFKTLYDGIETISLWEVIDKLENFPFPDYHGTEISIHDPCPVRGEPAIHQSIRSLLRKMNFRIAEAEAHGTSSICCGDGLYPACSMEELQKAMKKRADSMPAENVAVYCVSCIKSMTIGGKMPCYVIDLLFAEDTNPQETDTKKWHDALEAYIETH